MSLNIDQALHKLANQESNRSACSTQKQRFNPTQEPVARAATKLDKRLLTISGSSTVYSYVPKDALEASQEKEHNPCHKARGSKELVVICRRKNRREDYISEERKRAEGCE
jgi:hypothetical protein